MNGEQPWTTRLPRSGAFAVLVLLVLLVLGFGNQSAGAQTTDGEQTLQGRVNNVFDKDYELSQNYNTPGTNLFVGLRWQPK